MADLLGDLVEPEGSCGADGINLEHWADGTVDQEALLFAGLDDSDDELPGSLGLSADGGLPAAGETASPAVADTTAHHMGLDLPEGLAHPALHPGASPDHPHPPSSPTPALPASELVTTAANPASSTLAGSYITVDGEYEVAAGPFAPALRPPPLWPAITTGPHSEAWDAVDAFDPLAPSPAYLQVGKSPVVTPGSAGAIRTANGSCVCIADDGRADTVTPGPGGKSAEMHPSEPFLHVDHGTIGDDIGDDNGTERPPRSISTLSRPGSIGSGLRPGLSAGSGLSVPSSPDRSPVSGDGLRKRSTSSFAEVHARGLSSQNFDITRNVDTGDHREIETNQVEALMATLGCSFDDARLHLVMEQMREAGVDPETGLPISAKDGYDATTETLRNDWNNLLTGTRPPNHAIVEDGWKQLELLLSVKGIDTLDLSQAIEAEKVKAKQQKSRLRYGLSKLSSKWSGGDSPKLERASCRIEILMSRTVELLAGENGEPDDPDHLELVLVTESQPISTSIPFITSAMLSLPPPPAFSKIHFRFILESGNIVKVVGQAICNSNELFALPTNALMLESTVTNAVDSILTLQTKPSRRNWAPKIMSTSRWLSQSYRLETQLDMAGVVYEDLCETRLAFELPEKLLKIRADELIDEHARLEGKIGEMDVIISDTTSGTPVSNFVASSSLEGDLVVVDAAHEHDRVRRQQALARTTLQTLRDRCAGEVRNYRALVQYYRECVDTGVPTKYSSQRGESALRAVPTNLHVHSVSVRPQGTTFEEIPATATKAHSTITCGAPAAHSMGFQGGGLESMFDKARQAGVKLGCEHMTHTGMIHWSSAYIIRTFPGESELDEEPWVRVDAEAALAKLVFDCRIRADVVMSQALSLIAAAFVVRVEEVWRDNDPAAMSRFAKIGFLCSMESLLSTAGKEQSMLKDVQGVAELIKHSFSFRIQKRKPTQLQEAIQIVKNDQLSGYHIDVLVDEGAWSWIPDNAKGDANHIIILPVLFTQGVNEWQMLSNLVRSNSLQSQINAKSLRFLQHYAGLCSREELKLGQPSRGTQLASQSIMELSNPNKVTSPKDFEMLWMAADSCRMLGGGRITFCKSGKDRTSAAVTLESTRLLIRHNGLEGAWSQKLANLMRIYGVRRSNVFYNTGGFAYAFNSLQIRTLPPPYRPPPNTHK